MALDRIAFQPLRRHLIVNEILRFENPAKVLDRRPNIPLNLKLFQRLHHIPARFFARLGLSEQVSELRVGELVDPAKGRH